MSLGKSKWEDADEKFVGSYNRDEEGIHTKEEKGISIVERRERRDVQVYWKTTEEGVY